MSAHVLDAGCLVDVDRGDRRMAARLRIAERGGIDLRSNAAVVAQVWRDPSGRQADLARFLRCVDVKSVDRRLGREAGVRLGRARSGSHALELSSTTELGSQMSGSPIGPSLRFAVLSQLTLGVFLAVCVLLMPRFAFGAREGGVSNYGVHVATVIPYTVAFVSSASFLFLAGRRLRYTNGLQCAALGFEVVALMLVVVLVSTYPYKIDGTLADVHLGAAIGLFCAELPLVAWLASFVSSHPWRVVVWLGRLAALSWLVGAVMAVVTLLGFIHLLFLGQAVMSAGFAVVVIASLQAEIVPGRHR